MLPPEDVVRPRVQPKRENPVDDPAAPQPVDGDATRTAPGGATAREGAATQTVVDAFSPPYGGPASHRPYDFTDLTLAAARPDPGEESEPPDPASPEALEEAFPELETSRAETVESISDNAERLRDGTLEEKISAAAALARDLQPERLPELLEHLGIQDQATVKLLTDGDALGAASTLADPEASAADKASAALTLVDSIGELAPQELGEALRPYLATLPAASQLIDSIETFLDPEASALEKAEATLDLAVAVRDSVGEAFPELAQRLRATESFSRSLAAGLTLLDPDASLQDRAAAAVELAANVPSLAGDARAIGDFLRGQGVPDAEAVRAAIDELPIADRLPESLRDSLDPEVVADLTAEQADELTRLAADPELAESLATTLGRLHDPQAVGALLDSLDQLDDSGARKALLETLGGLQDGVADELLTSTIDGRPAAEALGDLMERLGPEGRESFAKLVKDFDKGALEIALRFTDGVGDDVLESTLRVLDDADSRQVATALKALDGILSRAGVALTGEIAETVLRGLTKIIPIAGAAPAGYDAVRLGGIAADTSLPPGIRFLALQGTKLNAVDAGLSLAEPFIAEFFGIPVAADIAIGIAELGIDLVVTDQLNRYEADPEGYQAPDWLGALNVALAAAQGPQGVAELALIYGPNGAVDLAGQTARFGGDAAIHAAEVSAELTAQGIGEGLHYTAEGLHLLADIVRNPSKYGEAAVELGQQAVAQLSELAQGAGELAQQAAEELGNLVSDLKDLGAEGIEALGWIATHPGEAAEQAISALSDLAERGIELGTAAGRAMAEGALTALGAARDALGAAGRAAEEAYDAASRAIDSAVDKAVELGERGIETLGWIANNPGEAAEIARQALVDVASEAGELAQAAYDQIVDLGQEGVELAQQVASNLVDAGEAAVEMLEYVVNNPGEAAEQVRRAAVEALGDIAEGVGDAADAAAEALVGFVDNGIQEAKDTVTHLLTSGGEAAQRVISTLDDELSEGMQEVVSGLADLGDAGLDALNDLKNAGVSFAGDVLDGLGWAYDNTIGRIPGL